MKPRLRPSLRALGVLLFSALSMSLTAGPAASGPFIWDDDDDRIDDRVETVNLLGFQFSFEQGDSTLRQRVQVERLGLGLVYGVYVVYDHDPTVADLHALTALGMPVLHRLHSIAAVRSVATFVQVQLASMLPGVERIEAVPLLYPVVRDAVASAGVRDASERVFPTWEHAGGAQGDGIVVAILDTGINDQAVDSYPGHESLIGRFVGGAEFVGSDSTFDTPKNGSMNPIDRGGQLTRAHGTHVAGTILGSGGTSGFARGVAPAARFVDVKVLNDLGRGTGVAEALDWCIHNRERNWSGDPLHTGIDVINLSLSSLDQTDGNDVASRLAHRATELGVVVVASIGNESHENYCPSPAGGDGVLAVGAWDVQRSPEAGDDLYPSFNDYGPRASDGDGDTHDEQKPDLLSSGVAVLAADGDLSSDGAQYQRLSGTSMAAAMVSGMVALLRSEAPSLSPGAISELLRKTARRDLTGLPPGVGGPDPRWFSPIGFGVADLYAAHLELFQPAISQVRRLALAADGNVIHALLWMQRERGAARWVFERAPDVAGAAGAFTAIDSVSAVGDSSLADAVNLHEYARTWAVPPAERNLAFWYRVAFTEGGVRRQSPARRFVSPGGTPAATVEVRIVHNAYDTDVDAAIEVGASSPGAATANGSLVIPLPGSSAATSSDWVTGISALGNIAWTFRIDVPENVANGYLPPSSLTPWRLRVTEGGTLNRSGSVTDFRVIHHAPGGDVVHEGGPTPRRTMEGQTWYLSTPLGTTSVEPGSDLAFRFGPNPVRAGGAVTFSAARDPKSVLEIYDLAGRRMGRVDFVASGASFRAVWNARDARGQTLVPGLYFARVRSGPMQRIVVLDP
jgi:Subtilase family